jgi:hypothetical protein
MVGRFCFAVFGGTLLMDNWAVARLFAVRSTESKLARYVSGYCPADFGVVAIYTVRGDSCDFDTIGN